MLHEIDVGADRGTVAAETPTPRGVIVSDVVVDIQLFGEIRNSIGCDLVGSLREAPIEDEVLQLSREVEAIAKAPRLYQSTFLC